MLRSLSKSKLCKVALLRQNGDQYEKIIDESSKYPILDKMLLGAGVCGILALYA